MVSRQKLFRQLDQLEFELEERLIAHLEHAAAGHNELVFCVHGLNRNPAMKHHSDKLTAELVGLGRQILVLKDKLGETSRGSIAERICWYCREWGDTVNSQPAKAQELAAQFLQEIENGKGTAGC